ncbi:unnamed protein product [Haemonchus placei]|uniref:Proteoglycan 4-like n=1 Tax=Haemonchus placei TaxID=6290 RepID=A0A0N4W435_HAEPC|nr:unnamed protein product [Haemonchus placei]
MARSVSRPRKSASKSPARVKKIPSSPKSEQKKITSSPKSKPKKTTSSPKPQPKKITSSPKSEQKKIMSSPKSEPKKKKTEKIKAKSRSRSVSKGRKDKQRKISPSKSISRSRSRPRPSKKLSPLRLPSPLKSDELKKSTANASAVKKPSVKTPTTKVPQLNTSSSSLSYMRPSRSVERKTFTSTPYDYEVRQRLLRPESSSRSPVRITPKKLAPTACARLYNRTYNTVSAAGRTVCNATRAACQSVVSNRREIFATLALLALVALITYFILYSDPAKTRAYIHSIPGRVQAWYNRQVGRK